MYTLRQSRLQNELKNIIMKTLAEGKEKKHTQTARRATQLQKKLRIKAPERMRDQNKS